MACGAVGAVDRCGQQNTLFVAFVGRAKRFQAYFICRIHYAYESLGSRDLVIFVLKTTTDQSNYFTPCACAQGKYSLQM